MKKGTKYLALFIMVLAVLFGISAREVSAAGRVRTGTLGINKGIQWSYDESTKTLTVTGEDRGLALSSQSPFKSICSDVETIIVKDCKLSGSVYGLFGNLTKLKSVTLENFDTTKVTNMSYMFSGCSSLTHWDVSGFDTSNVTSMRAMFANCSSLTALDLSGFDTSEVTDMYSMFYNCTGLTNLDLSGFNTSKVTNMSAMFDGCKSITNLDLRGFDTSNVTSMYGMFRYCSSMTDLDLRGFDTSNVTSMYAMFYDCSSLTVLDVSSFDTSNVTSMYDMFRYCSSLTDLDLSGLDTSKVTDMHSMFYNCSSLTVLDVSSFDTSNVTSMNSMFSGCSSLPSLDVSGFDTSEVTDMYSMFYNCTGLTNLDLSGFNTLKVTNMSAMFDGCKSVTNLDLSGFDTSNVTSMFDMFRYCSSMTDLDVSGFDTSNVRYMDDMFSFCDSLKGLDLSSFNTSKVTDMHSMFYNCSSLTVLDVSDFETSNVTSMNSMFSGCSSLTVLDVSSFDTSNVTSMFDMFKYCSSMTDLDVSGFDTSNVTSMNSMFYDCTGLTNLDVSGFDTSNVMSMSSMFYGCSSLSGLDVSGFDTANVKYMGAMFSGCKSLTDLDVSGFDVSKVTDMGYMFNGCSSLTNLDVSGFDTSNVTSMSSMFANCSSLPSLDVSGFDTSKVTNMSAMFDGCKSVTNLDVSGFDTSNVTSMYGMFRYCSSVTDLDVSGFDTSNVRYMYDMFSLCGSLTNLDVSAFDTSNVTDMSSMFSNCSSLTDLDVSGLETSKVTYMSYMFYGCSSLKGLDVSGFDVSKVTDMGYMFNGCSSLTDLDLSGFDTSNISKLGNMIDGCSALKFLYTPAVMREDQTISLPVALKNAKGEECIKITSDTCNMLLSKAGEKQDIKILADDTELFAGDSLQLALEVDNAVKRVSINKYYDWSSTAPGTAAVSADGLITAVGAGSTIIQVTVPGRSDLTAQLTIHVKDRVTLDMTEINDWEVGRTGNLSVYVNDKVVDADSMIWSSSNNEVATCEKGRLVGVGSGTAIISCTKKNGTVATCKVTVFEKLGITDQPANQSVAKATNAVFKVTATGDNLSYQWQFKNVGATKWTDSGMTGAKTNSITVQGTTERNGYQYRCIITDRRGNKVTSNAATLTVVEIVFTGQPISQSVTEGGSAVFKVIAEGNKLSYQWQFRTSFTDAWANSGMTGAKTSSITVQGTAARNGYQYRCVITDGTGNKVTSNGATLTVMPKLSITGQPKSQSVIEGASAVFKVTVTGNKLSYQWQFRTSASGTWKNSGMTGAKTNSITVQGTAARNGYQYRCIVTDGNGNKVTSNAATLTVTPKLVIASQPTSQSVAEGANAVFKVTATGNKLSYQWQFRTSSAGTWKNSGMTGATTGSITVQGTAARNGYQYRCVITDENGNKVTSTGATLTVAPKLAITGQPASQSVAKGTNAVFKVTATGSNLSYQWQVKTVGATKWTNSGMTGAKTSSITVQGTTARNDYQYRCVITDGSGNKVTSNAATLTVN